MIPILYEADETEYLSNGIGRLSDATKCIVTEERNGIYELEMDYPMTGARFDDIREGRIILAEPADGKTGQPFVIYKVTRPIKGIVTVYAEHVSYFLTKIPVMPFTAGSCTEALQKIKDNASLDCPFEFWTDKNVTASMKNDVPTSARALLGGSEGSILDTYGTGEYEWDRYTVKLYLHRGEDRGVTLKFGKNITDLTRETDTSKVYTSIAPFWKGNVDGDDITVTLPEKVVMSGHEDEYQYDMAVPVDFSSSFETLPTEEKLRARAQAYLRNNENWVPDTNIKVSFVALWQTEDYKDIAALQRVNLCDTVTVIYEALGVSHTLKVIKTQYNVLLDRYDGIELGTPKATLGETILSQVEVDIPSDLVNESSMEKAIRQATQLIKGGLGGHVVMNTNADGQPQEILVLDKPDIEQAVNVIRINKNGIGFSNTGYDGTYRTAWTIDSHFVADFITTGTLDAELIKTGLIKGKKGDSYWNMDTGEVYISSSAKLGDDDVSTWASAIRSTADGITAEITRAKSAEGTLSNSIRATADGLSAEITRAKGAEGTLTTSLKATADGLSSEVTRAKSAESSLSSRITQTANEISSKVSSGEVESIISQKADSIRLKASKISWSSTYSSMSEDGTLRCSDAELTGTLLCGQKRSGYQWIKMESDGEIRGGYGTSETGKIHFNGYVSGVGRGIHMQSDSIVFSVDDIGVTKYEGSTNVSFGITKEIKCYTEISGGSYSWTYLNFINGICVGG